MDDDFWAVLVGIFSIFCCLTARARSATHGAPTSPGARGEFAPIVMALQSNRVPLRLAVAQIFLDSAGRPICLERMAPSAGYHSHGCNRLTKDDLQGAFLSILI